VSERKLGIFFKSKEGENYNHRNTCSISRIYPPLAGYNLSLMQKLGKITVFGRALISGIIKERGSNFDR